MCVFVCETNTPGLKVIGRGYMREGSDYTAHSRLVRAALDYTGRKRGLEV